MVFSLSIVTTAGAPARVTVLATVRSLNRAVEPTITTIVAHRTPTTTTLMCVLRSARYME
jgi:hypothetical protein